MNKKEFMLVSIVIIIIFLSFIGYRYINISHQLKNQLYAEVKLLIDEARDRYRYVSEGGYNPVIIQDDLSKELIVDPNINTKEKLLKFLQKTYTDNAAQKICDELGYEEIDGKLYRALCDCIFIHDWDKASIKDIKVNPLTKSATVIFALPGPFAESNSNDSVKDIVKFKLIKSKDNTYKIDNMIGGW